MGKKGKDPKTKGKEKKGKVSVEKKQVIDPELLKDLDLKDVFRFWNGDVYLGQFNLTAQGEIFRQGRGKYFAADGCSLIGRWGNDVLLEAEKLSYPEGSWYRGALEDGGYSGPGVYSHPQLGTLDCDFLLGRPEGFVTLTDVDDNKWQGHASSGCLTLLPRNHFFDTEEALLRRREGERGRLKSDNRKSSGKMSVVSKISGLVGNEMLEIAEEDNYQQ